MSKSNGNMYEWVTHTANPLAGKCIHNCSYCYVEKIKNAKPVIKEKYSGKARLSENGLKDISGKGKFIFLVDMADLFANNVPLSVISKIIEKCKSKPGNKYLIQTKNTERLLECRLLISKNPELFSICTTFETNRTFSGSYNFSKYLGNAPKPMDRIEVFMRSELSIFDKYITIEPIMDFDLEVMVKAIKDVAPKQVNIGADSGNNHLPEPSKEKILNLIKELEKFTVVKQKTNLARLLF